MKKFLVSCVLAGTFSGVWCAPASAATDLGSRGEGLQQRFLLPGWRVPWWLRSCAGEDSGAPGYAWEIHNLAYPGKSVPSLR